MSAASDQSEWRLDVNSTIYLSEIVPEDSGAMIGLLNEPEIYQRTLRIPYPYTQAAAEQWLKTLAEGKAERGYASHFAVREASGRMIGSCGFNELTPSHRAELGYWLGRPYWGRGIMTDVVGKICEYAQQQWDIVRIFAYVFDLNAASARVLEKCGFTCEGYLRKHFHRDGRFIDARIYARCAKQHIGDA
jgi:RimJ/RimL family protein N-acetyltransferase